MLFWQCKKWERMGRSNTFQWDTTGSRWKWAENLTVVAFILFLFALIHKYILNTSRLFPRKCFYFSFNPNYNNILRTTRTYPDFNRLTLLATAVINTIKTRSNKITICSIWCAGRNNEGRWKSCVSKKRYYICKKFIYEKKRQSPNSVENMYRTY